MYNYYSDLNSWPLQVENGGNQVAELVVSGRLSREIVIPDDEGTIIRERLDRLEVILEENLGRKLREEVWL